MFRTHFGLTHNPFITNSSTAPLNSYNEIIYRFNSLKSYGGLILITGEAGRGKSHTAKEFLKSLNKNYYPIYISADYLTPFEFYFKIGKIIETPTPYNKVNAKLNIINALTNLYHKSNSPIILVIDEADTLSNLLLSSIDSLYNDLCNQNIKILIIFLGKVDIISKLKLQINKSLSQKIIINYKIPSLTIDDIKLYIKCLIENSKGNVDIFTDSSYEALLKISENSYRRVNSLLFNSMLIATINKTSIIDHEIVMRAHQEVSL